MVSSYPQIYTPRKLILSILDNYCTYHATMATKINAPRIFLPTKTQKNLPTKFNMRMVVSLLLDIDQVEGVCVFHYFINDNSLIKCYCLYYGCHKLLKVSVPT